MDAHLFRRFCDVLAPVLPGARLEKIHAPADDVLTLTFHANGQRRQLCWRFGRKEPLAFVLPEPATFGVTPSAQVMRLRKHLAGQRVRACVVQWLSRRLWLMTAQRAAADIASATSTTTPEGTRITWLCLDLREGPALHFLSPDDVPEPDAPRWPEAAELGEACACWRDWPVLTPALRRTLDQLEPPEQGALLEDLRTGGGDVFCYRDTADSIRAVSAWPLPLAQIREREWQEECNSDILDTLARAGRECVLARIAASADRDAALRQNRERRRLSRLERTLDEEQTRLEAMCARKPDALALQENVWQWPRELKAANVDVPEGKHGPARTIALDGRFTVRENMARLFHTADRGTRGLAHLAKRRAALAEAWRALGGMATTPAQGPAAGAGNGEHPAAAATASLPNLPKRVQGFVSSDGFVLLRGRDARGNVTARKLAAPHDLWLHAANGPGAHVIIRKAFPGQEVPQRTLDEAGCLAALKSWQQHAARAEILYCEVRHVKPMRNAPPGTVRMDKVWASREVAVDPALEPALLAKLARVE